MRGQRRLPDGMIKVYMKIGKPPFYLPEAIADSCVELAEMCGVKPQTIREEISRFKGGGLKREKFCAVIIELEDEERGH